MIPIAYAASNAQITAQCLVDKINTVFLFPLIGLLSAIAFLFFLYGAFEYVKNADNDSARATGQQHLLYGVLGLLVMVSAYAILSIAAGSFGIGINKVDCSNPSANNSFTAPGGGAFTGGIDVGADTSPGFGSGTNIDTAPNIGGTPTLGTPGAGDTAPTGSDCRIEDRIEMISCGNDPSCVTAMNDCNNHYDVQSSNRRGGRGQVIPATPENGLSAWHVECTYSVAVCN